MAWLRSALGVALLLAVFLTGAMAEEKIRVGVLKYGTVNWALDAMTRNGLDEENGVKVEIVPFAGEDASNVALQAGDVDIIVSDWLWVSRQRAAGADFTFAPYSTSVGSMMVAGDSDMRALADLKGKTVGVAGGPLDKNWLLIQALAKQKYDIDLAAENDVVFGAPPLLMAKVQSGELDAVLNFWHYAARLEAEGFRTLISGTDAAIQMGTSGPVAALGWVFRDSFADNKPKAIRGFLAADRATKDLLGSSDAEWEIVAPLTKAEDGKTLQTLRDRFREGIPSRSAADEEADARTLYRLLAGIGGEKLVGPSMELVEGTYWPGLADGG